MSEQTNEAKFGDWISVAERLPKLGQRVLGFNEEYGQRETPYVQWAQGSINRAKYGDEAGHFGWSEPQRNWGSSWEPTHWMPLPQPPAPDVPRVRGHDDGENHD